MLCVFFIYSIKISTHSFLIFHVIIMNIGGFFARVYFEESRLVREGHLKAVWGVSAVGGVRSGRGSARFPDGQTVFGGVLMYRQRFFACAKEGRQLGMMSAGWRRILSQLLQAPAWRASGLGGSGGLGW